MPFEEPYIQGNVGGDHADGCVLEMLACSQNKSEPQRRSQHEVELVCESKIFAT